MTDKVNISFRIKNISTLEFGIKNIPEIETIDKDLFQFQILPASFIDKEKNIIGIDTVVDIFIDVEKQKKVCELITRISYEVINLHDFYNNEDDAIIIPDQFMITLISIALSTTRGILTAKTEGTLLREVYLPILNPASFKPVEKNIISK